MITKLTESNTKTQNVDGIGISTNSYTITPITRLDHQAAVYVPVQLCNGATDKLNATTLEIVKLKLCESFGGATVERVTGLWINNHGELISDLIDKVYSFHNESRSAAESILLPIAQYIKATLKQDAVLIEIDGQGILV